MKVAVNREYKRGRASSVVAGVKTVPEDAKAVLILNVDQPRPSWLIDEVVEGHLQGTAKITIPVHGGRRGHPTVFDGSLREEMLGITEEGLGLKEVVRMDMGSGGVCGGVVVPDLPGHEHAGGVPGGAGSGGGVSKGAGLLDNEWEEPEPGAFHCGKYGA